MTLLAPQNDKIMFCPSGVSRSLTIFLFILRRFTVGASPDAPSVLNAHAVLNRRVWLIPASKNVQPASRMLFINVLLPPVRRV